MQGLMHMPQKMNCHVAMLTRKLLSFYMCTNESNSHNVLSHCLKANISLNHLLYCIICSVAFPKIISPQYEFWSGFIDCFIEQIICNTVYKGPIFPFTSSSTPISPLTHTSVNHKHAKEQQLDAPRKKLLSSSLFCKKIASLLFSTVILLMSIVNEDSIHKLLNNKWLNLIGYIFSLVF